MRRQNLLRLSLLVLVLSLAAIRPAYTSAAATSITGGTNGPLCNSGGYFTPSSTTVVSGGTVTFSVPSNDPYAGGIQISGFPQGSFTVPRGGSVTTQALTTNVSYQGTWPNSPSCIKGSGTITVQAAPNPPTPPSTPPTSTTTAPTSTPKSTAPTTTTPAASTTQSITAPETVVANVITVGGQKVTSIKDLTISPSQPLVLSGTTVPNGKITLTIHSNPTTATVQADASGNWSYTVTGLQPGDHIVSATVTDPATNQTSASAKLLAFTIATTSVASAPALTSTPMKKSSSSLVLASAGALAVLILAAVAAMVLKMRRKSSADAATTPPSVAPSPSVQQVPPAEPQMPPVSTLPQAGTQVSPTSGGAPAEDHKEGNS